MIVCYPLAYGDYRKETSLWMVHLHSYSQLFIILPLCQALNCQNKIIQLFFDRYICNFQALTIKLKEHHLYLCLKSNTQFLYLFSNPKYTVAKYCDSKHTNYNLHKPEISFLFNVIRIPCCEWSLKAVSCSLNWNT